MAGVCFSWQTGTKKMDSRFRQMDSNSRGPGVSIRFKDVFLTSRVLPLLFSYNPPYPVSPWAAKLRLRNPKGSPAPVFCHFRQAALYHPANRTVRPPLNLKRCRGSSRPPARRNTGNSSRTSFLFRRVNRQDDPATLERSLHLRKPYAHLRQSQFISILLFHYQPYCIEKHPISQPLFIFQS